MSKLDLRDQLTARYGSSQTPASTPVQIDTEKAFVVHAESGRTLITAPIREVANDHAGFTFLHGRLVGAEQPNRNGAFWSTEDLELGQHSVAGGPLNWLHDEERIIGCLRDGNFTPAKDDMPGHIASTATVWRYLFPQETAVVELAAKAGELFYSMECVSREVMCLDTPGRPGCGESFSYMDYDSGKSCAHLRERSSVRRFVDPIFLGAAVIVPPVKPGWADANADVIRQAAALSEKADLAHGSLSQKQAQDLAARVLIWGNRTS